MPAVTAYQMLIDGQWCMASDGAAFDCIDPSTGLPWARVPEATYADVNLAVEAAAVALDGPWGAMTPTQRGKHLARLADLLAAHSEEIGRIDLPDVRMVRRRTGPDGRASFVAC